jgi:starch-binding outer membrane protein SusE/F
MKKILYIFLMFIALGLWSCESDVLKVEVPDTVASNTMSALSTSTFTLLMDNKADVFQAFTWTAVDYGFNSVNTYTIQVDKAGNHFANAADVVSVTNALTASVTVGDINTILLSFLDPETPASVEFRVKTMINNDVPPVYSNTVTATITPYATVFKPIYMIGQATGGWNTSLAVEVPSPAYMKYTVIAYFTNSGTSSTFRFFAQADWNPTSYNYPYFTTNNAPTLLENAADGDSNFRFLGTTGWYRITVDLKNKTVDMAAVPEPLMYMTGDGVGGWDWAGNEVKMTWVKDGEWSATTDFINGKAFRFFAQKDWGPTSYNYPYFANGSVTDLLANANDGDKNFNVVAATGNYTITVNLNTLTVTMVAAK